MHNGAGVGYTLSDGPVQLFSAPQSFAKEDNKGEGERERERFSSVVEFVSAPVGCVLIAIV